MLAWRFLIRPSIRNTNLRRPVDSDAADSLFDKLRGRPNGRPLRLLTNTFREVWRARRSATSIFAASAGRAHRSFRLTPPGRFATVGGQCPGCSIIRTFLTVVLMVSLPRCGSLCHLRWPQPTGLALPSAPQGTRFPPSPPKSIRIARLFPVAQSSRRALAAPTARFAPHLRVALPPSVASVPVAQSFALP